MRSIAGLPQTSREGGAGDLADFFAQVPRSTTLPGWERRNKSMRMVAHDTGGVTLPMHAVTDRLQRLEEHLAITVIVAHSGAPMATRGDLGERLW